MNFRGRKMQFTFSKCISEDVICISEHVNCNSNHYSKSNLSLRATLYGEKYTKSDLCGICQCSICLANCFCVWYHVNTLYTKIALSPNSRTNRAVVHSVAPRSWKSHFLISS